MGIEASKRKHQVQVIDNASKDFEKINHISSLQSIHAVTDGCTRSFSCQWALRR